jgi:hypothetical protein
MRLWQTMLIALLVGPALSGCLPAHPAGDSLLIAHRFANAFAEDLVRLDIAVIERPPGDHYLSQDLWDLADEQTVDFERKSVLDDNGFRVGVIGGLLPSNLLALLSEKNCPDPHRVQMRAGGTTPVTLGADRAHVEFSLNQGEQVGRVRLEHARCLLEIMATPADDGRVTLHFTPVIKHGIARREPRVVRDPSGEHRWEMEVKQSAETYAALSWDLNISPEEYVVVGTRLDREETAGHAFFLDVQSSPPVQRLLVIRSGRVHTQSPPENMKDGSVAPLALQAGWRTARGFSPSDDAAAVSLRPK